MKKTVLLIGLGRFGKHAALTLEKLDDQVMVVDCNEERVDSVLPHVTNGQIGNSTNEDFLRSLGVGNFDLCIVAIGDNFQSSLETTSLLKELGAKFVVSRASSDVHAKFLLNNGADEVVYPEKQLARWTAFRYTADHILDYIEVDKEYSIFEVKIPDSWIGSTVKQLDLRKRFNINILGLKKDGKFNMSIQPDSVVEKGASMLVLGTVDDVNKCFHI